MHFGTVLITHNDNLYQVIRSFQERANFPVNEGKEQFNCDTVLKRAGIIYFCRIVEDAQIIEDNTQVITEKPNNTDEQIQLVEKNKEEIQTAEEGCIQGEVIPTTTN